MGEPIYWLMFIPNFHGFRPGSKLHPRLQASWCTWHWGQGSFRRTQDTAGMQGGVPEGLKCRCTQAPVVSHTKLPFKIGKLGLSKNWTYLKIISKSDGSSSPGPISGPTSDPKKSPSDHWTVRLSGAELFRHRDAPGRWWGRTQEMLAEKAGSVGWTWPLTRCISLGAQMRSRLQGKDWQDGYRWIESTNVLPLCNP